MDGAPPDLWLYTDGESFTAGDTVAFRASCSVPSTATLTITLDALEPRLVYESEEFAVGYHPAPVEAYATGCDWPVCYELPCVQAEWPSGFYIVRCSTAGAQAVGEHFFVVRPTPATIARPALSAGELLLVLSTNTWRRCASPPASCFVLVLRTANVDPCRPLSTPRVAIMTGVEPVLTRACMRATLPQPQTLRLVWVFRSPN